MFVVEVGAALTTACCSPALGQGEPSGFIAGRSPSGSGSPCSSPTSPRPWPRAGARPRPTSLRKTPNATPSPSRLGAGQDGPEEQVPAPELRKGDIVLVEAGDTIPGDGDVIEGDRLRRRVGHHRRIGPGHPGIRRRPLAPSPAAPGALRPASWCAITANPGETFLDRMIAMVEGAKRQKTPNEIALNILLAGLTIIFLLATATLLPFSVSASFAGQGSPVTITVLVALLVCLIPTTIGGLLSAIGIAGMDRLVQANVIATSGPGGGGRRRRGRAAAGQDRHHHPGQPPGDGVRPAPGVDAAPGWPTPPSSPAWPTRPPRAAASWSWPRSGIGLRERDIHALGAKFIPFTAQTRMSGVDLDGREIRKGAVDAIEALVQGAGRRAPRDAARRGRAHRPQRRHAAGRGRGRARCSGVIHLKDIVKGGIKERFAGPARDGHPHGHDHRRQPAHRRRHRRRGRGRRLPGPGHPRGQAGADPGRPGRAAGWWP